MAALLLASGCPSGCNGGGDGGGGDGGGIAVASLEISPPELSATADANFVLHVRARDADRNPLPDTYTAGVTWSSSSPNLVLPSPAKGSSILAGTKSSPNALPLTATLIASLGDIEGKARVKISAGSAPIVSDWIAAPHTSGDQAVIALLDGMSSSWRNDNTVAFVGGVPLENFKAHCNGANCGDAVLFSTNHAVTRIPLSWTDACDVVWLNSAEANTTCNIGRAPPSPPAPLKLAVYIAASGSEVLPTALADLEYARSIFKNARSGIFLASSPPTVAWATNVTLDLVGPEWKCPTSGEFSILTQLENVGIPANNFASDQITLVYVDELLQPTESGSDEVDFFGYACPWDPARGSIVFIDWLSRRHSTYPHELGHAVGPWGVPDFGHTKRAHGFDESNLLWPYEADWLPVSRDRFTIGQAFQMSLASGSALNRSSTAVTTGISCQSDPMVDVPCPRLSKDVGN
jgi:hypothetical protein